MDKYYQYSKISFIYVLISFLFLACSEEEEDPAPGLTEYEESVISYFKEVALGFEFDEVSEVTRKWSGKMKIYIGGKEDQTLLDELDNIIEEINGLATDGFGIEIANDSTDANFYLFFVSGQAYGEIVPSQADLVEDNFGLFKVFWDAADEINRGMMYVDIFRPEKVEQKHLLREELTQSLGLAKDSSRYPDSIFQSDWTNTTEYIEIDKDLIRLLYHPQMEAGLDASQVESRLREILLNEM